MKNYKITIKLESDAIPGSGEGLGAVINADIVFDDTGLPVIPAKRIKGCLREAANDVCTMLSKSGIDTLRLTLEKEKNIGEETGKEQYAFVNNLFGKPGREKSAPIYFSNLVLPDYTLNVNALAYFEKEYPAIVSSENVVQTFTVLRQSTAIDETGTADEHSLRTARVLKKGLLFEGSIRLQFPDTQQERLLALACSQLRRMGVKRSRGFGEISCRLWDGNEMIIVNL